MLLVSIWLGLLFISSSLIKSTWPQQAELSRKVVHIGAGFALPLAWFSHIPLSIALAAALLATALAAINHRWRLLPALEDVGRASIGTVAYGASITLLLGLFWPQRADLVCTAVLTMALGDGLAGLLGAHFPSRRWQLFGQTKSLLGTAVMAVITMLVLMVLLPQLPIYQLLAIAASATLLEQFSWGGIDNFSVPLLVAAMAHWLGS